MPHLREMGHIPNYVYLYTVNRVNNLAITVYLIHYVMVKITMRHFGAIYHTQVIIPCLFVYTVISYGFLILYVLIYSIKVIYSSDYQHIPYLKKCFNL